MLSIIQKVQIQHILTLVQWLSHTRYTNSSKSSASITIYVHKQKVSYPTFRMMDFYFINVGKNTLELHNKTNYKTWLKIQIFLNYRSL